MFNSPFGVVINNESQELDASVRAEVKAVVEQYEGQRPGRIRVACLSELTEEVAHKDVKGLLLGMLN